MTRKLICAFTVCMFLASCAFMMNLEGGWKDKQVQKHIKTLGGFMDILKGQTEGKYRYHILAGTAEDLIILANQMKDKAPDSYYILRAAELEEKAMVLSTAVSRQNAEDTKQAVDDLLALWEIFVQYIKPAV